jgi:condensin complex subunit 1
MILQTSYEGLNIVKKNNAKKVMYYLIQYLLKAEQLHGSGSKDLGLLAGGTGIGENGPLKKTKKGKSSASSSAAFDWIECRRSGLSTLHDIVSSKLSYFWTMGLVEETFTTSIWRYCLDLLESKPTGITGNGANESHSRSLCVQIISKSIGHFGNPLTSGSYSALANAAIDCIKKAGEHMANHIAEIIHQESVLHHTQQIAREMTTEIVKMHQTSNQSNTTASASSSATSQGIKHISIFLEAFARVDTAVFSQFMPILVKLIDEQSHYLRNGMINAMTHVIEYIHLYLTKPQPSLPEVGEDGALLTSSQQIEDAETLQRNLDSLARQRDSLLNMLIERTHDVSPHTRQAILKAWTTLMDNHAIPAKRVGAVSEVAVDRLYDKNSFVRRNAIALLTTILDNNPFSGKLDKDLFVKQKEEVEKLITQRMEELSEKAGAPVELDPENGEIGVKKTKLPIETKKPMKRKREDMDRDDEEEEDEEDDEEDAGVDEEELLKDANNDEAIIEYNNKLEYITSAIEFIQAIESAVTKISSLLESKNASDVVESLKFFNRAVNFSIDGALDRFKE